MSPGGPFLMSLDSVSANVGGRACIATLCERFRSMQDLETRRAAQ
jgi:hypothetical protein